MAALACGQPHYSRTYPVDNEEGRGSCLVISLPGRKNRKKEEELRHSLLEDTSRSNLNAWTTSATLQSEEQEESLGLFSEDSSNFKTVQETKKESAPPPSEKSDLLKMPSSGNRRRRSPMYEGEQEPQGIRGQEAKVHKPKGSHPIMPDTPSMRSFTSQNCTPRNNSVRLLSPPETAPRRQASRREKKGKPPNYRASRLELLPVSETSIPEGIEEESMDTDADERMPREDSLRKKRDSSRSPSESTKTALFKLQESPNTVLDPRAYRDQTPQSQPGGSRKSIERSLSRSSTLNQSLESTRELSEMMPDLIPTSSPTDSRGSTVNSRSRGSATSQSNRGRNIAAILSPETQSSALTEQKSKIVSLEHANEMNAAAVEHVENGEFDLALSAFEQVLDAYREIYGDAHPLVASTYHNLGMVHSKRASLLLDGTYHQNHCRQQSLECFQAAARTGRDSLGANHPNVAVSLVRVGFLLLQARQYQNAFVTFKEALRIRLEYYGVEPPHSLVANLYNNLGVCKMHLGQYKEGSSLLKTALDIQRRVLRNKRQEGDVSRRELRNYLLEVADTLCNLGGLNLEWIRQQGPDARHSAEAEAAFAEALEIRTTVLGPSHALVQQVRTLHEMALSTPVPSQASFVEKGQADVTPPFRPIKGKARTEASRKNDTFESAEDNLDGGFLKSSLVSEPSHDMAATPISRQLSTRTEKLHNKSKCSPPIAEIRLGRDGHGINSMAPVETRDISQLNLAGTKIRMAPHCIPLSSTPIKKPRDMSEQSDDSEMFPSSSINSSPDSAAAPANFQGLRDLSLESAAAGGNLQPYYYDAEESCLIGDIGGESDRTTSLFLSMLEQEGSFNAENSRTLMVVRPFDAVFESPPPSAKGGRTASFGRAMSKAGASPNGDVDQRGKTMKLNNESTMYGVSPKQNPSAADLPLMVTENENGLAHLGGNWVTSSGLNTGGALTKEILDCPEDHLDIIYEAACRYLKRNQFREASHLFQTILECQRRTYGELHADVGAAWHNVGITYLRGEKTDRALRAFEKAAHVRKGSLGKDHPEVAVSLVKVGISQLLLHNFEDALLAFREALAVRRHSLGALHPSTARVYNNIGCVHMEFQELPEARRSFEAALDIQRNALCNEPTNGPLLFGTATTLCNLGYLYRYRGMPERAVLVLKEALSIQEHILGPNHQTVLSTMDSLADASAKSGDGTGALQYYGEILDRYTVSLGRESASTSSGAEAILLFKMSRVHHLQKDRVGELTKLQMALQAIRAIDDRSMNDEERAEIDRLSVLISAYIRKVSDNLERKNFDWL